MSRRCPRCKKQISDGAQCACLPGKEKSRQKTETMRANILKVCEQPTGMRNLIRSLGFLSNNPVVRREVYLMIDEGLLEKVEVPAIGGVKAATNAFRTVAR